MKKFETLDRYTTPEGRELTLHRHDRDYYVHLDGDELMASRAPGSERTLAELGCEGLGAGARVLIGGLGLGFTLRAALDALPSRAEVVVAELFEKVIEWNRTWLSELQGDALTDRRTRIARADVRDLIVRERPWHAILLDVDNGPDAWCFDSNRHLYDREGLERLRTSLTPGGAVAFWAAQDDPRFVKRLRKSGFSARSHTARERPGRGARHTIFVARPLPGRRPSYPGGGSKPAAAAKTRPRSR